MKIFSQEIKVVDVSKEEVFIVASHDNGDNHDQADLMKSDSNGLVFHFAREGIVFHSRDVEYQ